jgi:RimJ/RimL family protein N-acetyltransferase
MGQIRTGRSLDDGRNLARRLVWLHVCFPKGAASAEAIMIGSQLGLRPAQSADIPFIMATERIPGFEKFVGRWSEKEHLAALRAPDYAYFLGMNAAGERMAFAIIRDLHDAHGNVCLKRMAVPAPGKGVGSRFLGTVVRWVFTETEAYRLWLDVLADNARARHVYLSHGFFEEGVLRNAYKLMDGSRIDLILMSLLRTDWRVRVDQELD